MRNKPDQYFHERSYDHVTLRLICVLAMGISYRHFKPRDHFSPPFLASRRVCTPEDIIIMIVASVWKL
ncbi:hypothetical protein EB796_014450 [Bugula neritina]|uniref:Uncharacterized protein n=1 Tax=Bugula neritina TaxID=10212 RepID=A0A7J7JNL5_BUGNE|nr:hypothetical protein EB796_014450 [Bugula neritina]